MNPEYEVQRVIKPNGEVDNYRITRISSDDRVATCYVKANAEAVCNALNDSAAKTYLVVAPEKRGRDLVVESFGNLGLAVVLQNVKAEFIRAKTLFPDKFVNQHEAYAVILEEMDELWDEIKKNQKNYDLDAQRKEATQLAAMVIRFLVELV